MNILTPSVIRRVHRYFQEKKLTKLKKMIKFINDELEISSDESDEEFTNVN